MGCLWLECLIRVLCFGLFYSIIVQIKEKYSTHADGQHHPTMPHGLKLFQEFYLVCFLKNGQHLTPIHDLISPIIILIHLVDHSEHWHQSPHTNQHNYLTCNIRYNPVTQFSDNQSMLDPPQTA